MTYYQPADAQFNDPGRFYGLPDERGPVFEVDPKSFLFNYMEKNLMQGPPEDIDVYEQYIYREDPTPSFRVDPSKLDLRQFRNPALPVTPREFLERDQFLLLNPRSPLS